MDCYNSRNGQNNIFQNLSRATKLESVCQMVKIKARLHLPFTHAFTAWHFRRTYLAYYNPSANKICSLKTQ